MYPSTTKKIVHVYIPLVILFSISTWQLFINIPILGFGFLNAGDNHIHISIANHLYEVISQEHRILGWNSLYGSGTPLFLLRPPGLYLVTSIFSILTEIPVEHAMKILIILALGLYPVTTFIGCRLLGLNSWISTIAAALCPLCISTWGHTLDAYHFLGIHKQLLAIFVFPVIVGTLWKLMTCGSLGWLFSVGFAAMFLTHPYIAYCLVLVSPALLLVLFTDTDHNSLASRLCSGVLWLIPTALLICWWVIPFSFSEEIQQVAPFQYARKYFDVIVCTVAETLRQFFLGGIFDTTKWAGAFGNHEWGWRNNDATLRLPALTIFCCLGLIFTVKNLFKKERIAQYIFILLGFFISLIIFIGPDDYPLLDTIPFSNKFQNIHSIFLLEYFCILLGAIGIFELIVRAGNLRSTRWRVVTIFTSLSLVMSLWFIAARERTIVASAIVDKKSLETEGGELLSGRNMLRHWNSFYPIVEYLQSSPAKGAVATSNHIDMDSMVLDLLPGMIHRPMFLCGFEENGGVYSILSERYRRILPVQPALQRLFDIHFGISALAIDKTSLKWPSTMHKVLSNDYWELYEVSSHDYGHLEILTDPIFVGFRGSENEWSLLMKYWLDAYDKGFTNNIWIIDLSYVPQNSTENTPNISNVIYGANTTPSPQDKEHHQKLNTLLKTPPEELFRSLAMQLQPGPSEPHNIHITNEGNNTFNLSNHPKPVAALYKTAYYRGWRAQTEGLELPLYRISPGLQMVMIPANTTKIQWRYLGPNKHLLSIGALSIGFLMIIGLLITHSYCKNVISPLQEYVTKLMNYKVVKKFQYRTPQILMIIITLSMVFKASSEWFFNIPITIHPANKQIISLNSGNGIDFYWNYVVGFPRTQQHFTLEIATDENFNQIVNTTRGQTEHVRIGSDFKPDTTYYYRLRLEQPARSPWTSTRTFRVVDE